MSSLGSLNVTIVLVNFTVSCIDLRALFNSTRNIKSFSSVKTDYLDLLCPKLSKKQVAGIVMNFALVRRCLVFPNFCPLNF